MDTKGRITSELIKAKDKKDMEMDHALIGYGMLESQAEKVMFARDVFMGFDESAQPYRTITTQAKLEDRPDVVMDVRVEFPTVNDTDEESLLPYKWTNELVVNARTNDGDIRHDQPEFVHVGTVRFNADGPVVLHGNGVNVKEVKFDVADPREIEEIMGFIDAAVFDVFEKNEAIRKKVGQPALAAYWEKMLAEMPEQEKVGIFSRIKERLFGERPE
jgi:hypothetical protein